MTRHASAWVWLLAFGCTGSRAPRHNDHDEPLIPAPDLLHLPAPAVGAPRWPGPAPRARTFDAGKINGACERCHQEIAAEWRSSLHQRSHQDETYRHQFQKEPFPFCTACHAPEARPEGPVSAAESDVGVGCVTCHVVGDEVLAGANDDTSSDGRHHALERRPRFGTDGCANCHEFNFPASRASLFMQSTMSEHAASPYAEESCASCHMPLVIDSRGHSHRSHRFAASRDETAVRSAVAVDARIQDDGFQLTATLQRVGHAFPTGDMLRQITLAVEVRDADGIVHDRFRHVFKRRFGFRRRPNAPLRRVELEDTRVGVGGRERTVTIALPRRPPHGEVWYQLAYERVADPNGEDGQPVLAGRIVIAEATLPITR